MIICVVGPTGVGKTKLSESLAKHYNGIIINSDAFQIYKEMNIGTAKIKESQKENVEHYLFNIKDPSEEYSVYEYQSDARDVIEANKNKNIILVGGTGLYLKAVLYDYKFGEKKAVDYTSYTNSELYEMLDTKDKETLHINNRQRMISKLTNKEEYIGKDTLVYENIIIGLTTNRDKLYEIINNRVDSMFKEGLISEVKDLYQKYGKVRSLSSAIGYKEIIEYFDGNISLEDAKDLIKKKSRNYAKRQYTWFNNQFNNIEWFNVDYNDFDKTIKSVIDYIDKQNLNVIK